MCFVTLSILGAGPSLESLKERPAVEKGSWDLYLPRNLDTNYLVERIDISLLTVCGASYAIE
jgi:hypothetical protein